MLLSKYMRLNCQILSPISETSEKFCHSKPRTTEGPRTTEARTKEVLLY